MPLLERGYRAAAQTELERNIRLLEDRDKAAQGKVDVDTAAVAARNNVDFCLRTGLIQAKQADRYRERIEYALKAEEQIKAQSGEVVDGYTNPHEQSRKYYDLEQVQAQIKEEQKNRAGAEQAEPKQKSAHTQTEMERTPPNHP